MLLEYSCKNFKSIGYNPGVFFSMLASSDKENPHDILLFNNYRVLRSSILYGANGSGKTNFIRSIMFLKDIVSKSHLNPPELKLNVPKHKLYLKNNSEFFMQFVAPNNIRYAYGVSIGDGFITSEFLYYFPNGKQTKIFERRNGLLKYNESYATAFLKVENQFLMPNRLMLSCAGNFSNLEVVISPYLFFSKYLKVFNTRFYEDEVTWEIFSARKAEDKKYSGMFENFMKSINVNQFKGISAIVKEYKFSKSDVPDIFNEKIKNDLINKVNYHPEVKFLYNNFSVALDNESRGNQKLFEIFFPLLDVIENNYVFICDEFDLHLHSSLTKILFNYFQRFDSKAQIITSTHDTTLQNLNYFRRDQIWFLNNNNATRSTDIYSLAELKGIRKDESIMKNYLLGKYSDIPNLDDRMAYRKFKK